MNVPIDICKKLAEIRNIYWHIRQVRPFQTTLRRRLYRDVKKIKIMLIQNNVDVEQLRLLCRALAKFNLDNNKIREIELSLLRNVE